MTIIGFTFNKINAEKSEGVKGKINISNNVAIKEIKEINISFEAKDQQAISFVFEFTSKYEPKAGSINLVGSVTYLVAKKDAKNIISEFKKTKKIPEDITKNLLNTILTKSNIQALIISKEIGLPPPIPLPKIGVKK